MRVERGWLGVGRGELEQKQVARRAGARRSVDQNRELVAVRELVGEIESANAEVSNGDPGRQRLFGERAGDGAAEAVVAEEDVADAGHEHVHSGPAVSGASSSSSGAKKKRCPGCPL